MKTEYVKDDKVVSIKPMRARALFPALGKVEAYWEGLRNGRLMPARAEIDPRGIADALEFAFVLERIAPGLARIRLAGMHLNELMAMEVRGMPVTAIFLPEARRELQRVLENVMEEPAAVRLTLVSDSGFSRPPLEAQMLLLPLRDGAGRSTRILGALQARGDIGRGPRRFKIRDIETKPLRGDPLTVKRRDLSAYEVPGAPRRPVNPIVPTRPATTGPVDDFAPRTAELARKIARRRKAAETAAREAAPTGAAGTAHPHLRLVHDADHV